MNARPRLDLNANLRAANARSVRTLSSEALEIAVVFTRMRHATYPEGDHHSLRLVKGLLARIRLLVPHIVPYGVPVDKPLVPTPFLERRFRLMVDDLDVEIVSTSVCAATNGRCSTECSHRSP